MAVAVVLDFHGATLQQYDEVIRKMNFTPRGQGASGGLFHWCPATDHGIRVTDVWETREQFDDLRERADRPDHSWGWRSCSARGHGVRGPHL